MYLSRLVIKNFRSISEIDITFSPGKNIVIGKNNAGKSNILKAIDILLGDYKPDYSKTENITLEDFHNGKVDEPIYIFGELIRNDGEALNFDEIKKSSPFNLHASGSYRNKTLVGHSLTDNKFFAQLDACLNIFSDADGIQKLWIGEKSYCEMSFESFFNDKYSFAYAFRAYCDDQDKVQKDLRFFVREQSTEKWFMAFSASIRNELLQSAVIPSFRDPQSQLRINQWSWFGKLLKATIKGDDPGLLKAFHSLKKSSNRVFKQLQSEINHHRVKVA
ncbi:MAG: DUF2813 domain-containing protein, partial [Erysipelotrichia bacterium]|nr:DUF2813 domain-containing protein [Erysipelotrichia bacterium]